MENVLFTSVCAWSKLGVSAVTFFLPSFCLSCIRYQVTLFHCCCIVLDVLVRDVLLLLSAVVGFCYDSQSEILVKTYQVVAS